MNYIPRLKTKYQDEIVPALIKKFDYKTPMQVPKLTKISLNQGLGEAIADKKLIDTGVEEMTMISGQKAVPTKSKNGFVLSSLTQVFGFLVWMGAQLGGTWKFVNRTL